MTAALCGVSSATCLMVSVVNRGVQSGGGDGVGYGKNIVFLFGHYVDLLVERATDLEAFGPLETAAIILQIISLTFAAYAIISPAFREEKEITCVENQNRIAQLENGGDSIFDIIENGSKNGLSAKDMSEEECLLDYDTINKKK